MVSLVSSLAPLLGDWEAAGHRLERHWLDDSARYGPWLFVALLTLVVSRALWRQRRYRAVDTLGTAERSARRPTSIPTRRGSARSRSVLPAR